MKNLKIGDKLTCKKDHIGKNSSGIQYEFFKNKSYKIVDIKYRDAFGNDINFKPRLGKVQYDIIDDNNRHCYIVCEYNFNDNEYFEDENFFNDLFNTIIQVRKQKLINLKRIMKLNIKKK